MIFFKICAISLIAADVLIATVLGMIGLFMGPLSVVPDIINIFVIVAVAVSVNLVDSHKERVAIVIAGVPLVFIGIGAAILR